LQLCDPVEQFQRQRGASKVDTQIALQMNRGSHPTHAADMEVPFWRVSHVGLAVAGVKNAFPDQRDDFLGFNRAMVAQFFQGDEGLFADKFGDVLRYPPVAV